MGDLAAIIPVISAVIGLLFTTLTYIFKFIKSEKAKKCAEQIIKVGDVVIPFIKQAEQFADYTGEEKKDFVLEKVAQFAMTYGITFDKKLISEKIEELITLTKQVNKRDKDTKALNN